MSALGAGVRLLPFAIPCAIGSALTAAVAGRAKIPPIYLMLGGSAIQVVGFALLSTAPETTHISSAQYGYEAIAGFAVGISLCCVILMTPFAVEKRDKCSYFHVTSGPILVWPTDTTPSCGDERGDTVPHHGWRHRPCDCHDCDQQLLEESPGGPSTPGSDRCSTAIDRCSRDVASGVGGNCKRHLCTRVQFTTADYDWLFCGPDTGHFPHVAEKTDCGVKKRRIGVQHDHDLVLVH